MTEEMEKKLNELLGLKKQIEEITADKKKSDAVSVYEEQGRKTKVYYYIYLAISIVIMLLGLSGLYLNTGRYQLLSLFAALVGFESTVLMKMWYHTITSRLAILRELKQFELRMTELLQK
jgi:hypothetical protein